ncbi:MAG: hypothetical protein HFE52_07470 [Clostridia bacterium]|nr:hypothetical protein [Clostridia bacterium]
MISEEIVMKCNHCGYCFDGSNIYNCPNYESDDISDEDLTEEEIEEVRGRWYVD